jgi:hypothetical protein
VTAAAPPAVSQSVLTITHRYGDDITVHADRAEAMRELAGFARQWWHEIRSWRAAPPGDPVAPGEPPQDDAETIWIYFAWQPEEYWDITEVPAARVDCDDDVQLVPGAVMAAMAAIVDYNWQSEQRDYAECGDPPRGNGNSREDHVFRRLQLVRHWLELAGGGPDAVTVRTKAARNAPPDPALVSSYAAAVLAAIAEDKQAGHVPAWVFTFSGLHDWTDANMYLIEAVPQGAMPAAQWTDLTIAVEDEVNTRLVAAELARGRQLTEPGDGFTEITTQCCHRLAVRLGDVAGQTITCTGQNPKTSAPCEMPLAIPAAAEDPVIWVRWGHRQHNNGEDRAGRGDEQP